MNTQPQKPKGLKKALEALRDAVDDLTSLHVQTFSGSLKFTTEGNSFDNVRKTIEDAKNAGEITLIAESLFKFDGDSYNFLANDEGGVPPSALELHKASVESGIKTRESLCKMVKGIFD